MAGHYLCQSFAVGDTLTDGDDDGVLYPFLVLLHHKT